MYYSNIGSFYYISLLFFATQVLLSTSTPPAGVLNNCNCVAFRLDDIQDYWISDAQKAVIDVFEEFKIPITVGIIANNFGTDGDMVNYIKNKASVEDWDFEICNHGYNHEKFDTFSFEQQKKLLSDAVEKTISDLDGVITSIPTFIPPLNAFNQDTIRALKATGFTSFSSMIEVDTSRPYPKSGADLFHWPIGSATADTEIEEYFIGINASTTMSRIERQLAIDGFSSVMMHPQEFCILDSNFQPTDTVDTQMIAQLRSLLQMVQARGLQFVTLGGIADAFKGTYDLSGRRGNHVGSPAPTTQKASTTRTISTGRLTTGKLTTGSTTSRSLTTGSTTGRPLTTASTTGRPLTTGLTTSRPLTTGITSGLISTGSVTSSEITSSEITSSQLSTGAITTTAIDVDCTLGEENCGCDNNGLCSNGLQCSFNLCIQETSSSSSILSPNYLFLLLLLLLLKIFIF